MSAPASTNLIDILTLPATGLANVSEVDLAISCELMTNQLKATPLDPNQNILVAQDSDGRPMIFSIGNEGQFNLLRFTQGAAGYQLIDLLKGFAGYTAAASFDLSQDTHGRISIVVALKKANNAATDLYMASMLSNDDTQTNWSVFSTLCVKLQGSDTNFVAGAIRLGSSDDGKAPMAAIAGADGAGAQEFYYLLTNPQQPLQQKELPENTTSGAALDVGFAYGQRGLFFLYKEGASQTLECTTLPDQFEGSETYDFSPSNPHIPAQYQNTPYNCIAVAAGMNTNPMTISSDLYVGTDKGIFLFKGCDVANGFQVVTSNIQDVHQLVVCETSTSIVIWAFASPNRLYYIVGKKGATYQWNDPILFQQSAIHVAPIRYADDNANEVYIVDQQENLLHYWQDPNTTIWYNQTLRVKTENFLVNFTSFTTNIVVTDQNGMPVAGKNLQLTSASWMYATINGLYYSIDKDTPATVTTDDHGSINIIQMTTDIAPPELFLDADFINSTVTIYPNGKIQKGLQAVKSGADLKSAKGQDGKPVLTQSYSDDTLNGVAANVGQVNGAAQSDGMRNIVAGNQFAAIVPKGTKPTTLLTAHLPANFSVGMKLSNGTWTVHHDTQGLVKGAGIGDEIVTVLGDALHYLETALEDGIKLVEKGVTYLTDGVSFVISKVEEGLQFVLNVAGKVLKVILSTVVSVFKVLNWILKLIGIDLLAILRWLGHLLGLDDIWATHKVLAAMMKNGVNYGADRFVSAIDGIKAHITKFFDQAESLLTNNKPSSTVASTSLNSRSLINHPFNSSSGSWMSKQIKHNGLIAGGTPGPKPTGGSSGNPFQQFIADVINPTIQALQADLKQDFIDISKLFSGDINGLLQLAPDLLKTVLDPIKTIIIGLLDFLEDIVKDLAGFLTQPLDIPFLSAFYEFITDLFGDEEELTICNAVALIVAVPYSIVMKIMTGNVPLADNSEGLDNPNFFQTLLGNQSGLVSASGAAASYAKIGGTIASFTGLINAGVTMYVAASEESPWADGMSTAAMIQVGLGIAMAVATIPMKQSDPNDTALGLAITNFILSTIKNVTFPFILSKASAAAALLFSKIQNGLLSAVDAIIFILAIPLDIFAKASALGWPADMLSNLGGAVFDGCQCASKFDPEPDTKAALQVASVLGGGAMLFGGFFFLGNALAAGDVIYTINVAG